MFNSILGLPAHPLVVHGAVVLVPLAALAGLAVLWPAGRAKIAPAALALATLAGVFVFVSLETGETLERQVPETDLVETHAELGETLLPIVTGLWLGLAIIVGLAWYVARHQEAAGRTAVRAAGVVALVIVVLTAVGSTVQVGRIGHSGAKAVWHGVDTSKTLPENEEKE